MTIRKRKKSLKPVRKRKKTQVKKKKTKKKIRPAVSALKTKQAGRVTHYFPNVKAAALVILTGVIRVGDILWFKGHTTDFKQKVRSMQIDRIPVAKAKKGAEIGIRVKKRVRVNDHVYRLG